MTSYWRSGDKINLDQTEVEISAENGLSFQENQTIGIYIPPNVRFFSGKESRLSFDVELSGDTSNGFGATALMLDGGIGGQNLFSKCRIYAGNRSQIIEETDEYDTLVSVKYSYESNDSLRSKRALTEGASTWTPECRSTTGQIKSNQSDVMTNPYFQQRFHNQNKENGLGAGDSAAFSTRVQKAHIEMPLHMGCFANNSKAFPAILTDGLYVELTCNKAAKVVRTLDTTNISRSAFNVPRVTGVGLKSAATGGVGTDWAAADAAKSDELFLDKATNMAIDAQHCPFQVGEILGIRQIINTAGATFGDVRDIETDDVMIVKNITTNAGGDTIIQLVTETKPKAAADDLTFTAQECWVYSKSLDSLNGKDSATPPASSGFTYSPSYTISDVKMIVHRVDVGPEYESGMMAKMKQGGVIAFDIPSVACQKTSVLKNDRQATINLSIDHAKARSIISVPTDATIYTPQASINSQGTYRYFADSVTGWSSDATGLHGCGNNLSSYNYQLNGMLVPSRAVKTEKSSFEDGGVDGEHILELEKSLLGGGIVPLSFKDYRKNFCIGRVLAMDANTVYDGRGVDTRLLLRYDKQQADVQTLWKHYCFHIKTLQIRGDGLTVEN